MPFYSGPTAPVAAILNTLKTGVQAEIDRLWTEFGDAATIKKPTPGSTFDLKTFYKHFHLSRSDYPHLMVYGDSGDMASGGGEEGDVSDWDHLVWVEGWVKGDHEEHMQEQVGRIAWACIRCLANNSAVLDGTLAGLAMGFPRSYQLGQGTVKGANGQISIPLRGFRFPVKVRKVEAM